MARAAAPGRSFRVTPLSLVQDATLVLVSALFFSANVVEALKGDIASIPFACEQGLLVGIFISRRRSIATTRRPLDWLVASGSWLPLFLRPAGAAGTAQQTIGFSIQAVGLVLVLVGFAYLGRSFGVVAANRGLKINGPYRVVRHPVYAAHFLTTTGFLVANPGAINLALCAATAACQLLRIRAEERILAETANYAEYKGRVKWRLVPGLF